MVMAVQMVVKPPVQELVRMDARHYAMAHVKTLVVERASMYQQEALVQAVPVYALLIVTTLAR